ncbi:MAG: methionine--tRNA ligase, partial [Verrucomicrobiota bacterium]
AKDPAQEKRLDLVLAHLVETSRCLSVLVEAVVPQSAAKIRVMLKLPAEPMLLKEAVFGKSLTGQTMGAAEILFPRIEEEKVA